MILLCEKTETLRLFGRGDFFLYGRKEETTFPSFREEVISLWAVKSVKIAAAEAADRGEKDGRFKSIRLGPQSMSDTAFAAVSILLFCSHLVYARQLN